MISISKKARALLTSGDRPRGGPMAQRRPPLFQAHPWHGISPGRNAPDEVTAYIEIVPNESVKYELHKDSGHLRVDRPQRLSSNCPTLYGFIPQTLCDREVARFTQ